MLLPQVHDDALLALFSFCSDRTLANLATTCQALWELSKSNLKHRKYIKRWSTIKLAHTWHDWLHHEAEWKHPIEIIAKIREDPLIVKYIKRIEFTPPNPRDWGREEEYGQNIKELVESCNYLEDEINEFTFLKSAEMKTWKEEVRKFNANPCFVVLFSLCKRTEELFLSSPNDLPYYFNSVINHMRANDKELSMEHTETNLLGHFPAVTKLELTHWDTEIGLSFEDAWPIVRLPSLRKFHGNMLGDDYDYEDLNWPNDLIGCRLETIVITTTQINPPRLVQWIHQLPFLKELFYGGGRIDFQDMDESGDWDDTIDGYAESLRRHGEALFKRRSYRVTVEMYSEAGRLESFDAVCIRKFELKQ